MTTEDGHQLNDDATWLKGLADAAVHTPQADAAGASAPPLDRPRPERRAVVPRPVWMGVLGAVLIVAVVTAIAVFASSRSAIPVPGVVGLELGVARTTLKRVGLTLTVTGERFSDAPKDTILEQSPAAGGTLDDGAAVEVIVSAGTEEFALPDVVGDGLALAMGLLQDRGLTVEVERVVSNVASDTVLSSVPAAGATVRTGDTVRLQVSSLRDVNVDLRPFRMDGVVVAIDPAPAPKGLASDPALEVARRLEAMLGASGARAVVLRSTLDTSPTDAVRARKAKESSATVCIGLTVAASGEAGRIVSAPPSQTVGVGSASSKLAQALIVALSPTAGPVKRSDSAYDPIFTPTRVPWSRVLIGSAEAREDTNLFADPGWADRVARALYTALGQTYGQAVLP